MHSVVRTPGFSKKLAQFLKVWNSTTGGSWGGFCRYLRMMGSQKIVLLSITFLFTYQGDSSVTVCVKYVSKSVSFPLATK